MVVVMLMALVITATIIMVSGMVIAMALYILLVMDVEKLILTMIMMTILMECGAVKATAMVIVLKIVTLAMAMCFILKTC